MKRLLLAAMLGILSAQAPQQKPGAIKGTVMRLGTKDPIAGASVVLQPNPLSPRRSTTTDGNGGFTFADMAPGTYAIVAEREGYLAGHNGITTETVAISTVKVEEGATAQLAIELLRPAIVRGKIAASDGNPKAGLTVDLLRISYDAMGRAQPEIRKRTVTNERGEYEFAGLIPADHYLRAGMPALDAKPGAVNARITYYPGTPDAANAAPIVLKQGDELTADFREHNQDAFTVRGRIISFLPGAEGPPRLQMNLRRQTSGSSLDSPASFYLPQGSDGSFEIAGVAPGTYDLTAIGEVWTRGINGRGRGTITLAARYVSRTPIQVRNQDVENVSLTLKPGVEVHGRLILEEGDGQGARFPTQVWPPVLQQGRLPNDLRIGLLSKDADGGRFSFNASNTEGTAFTALNVSEGEYSIDAMGNPLMPFSTYIADVFSGARSVLTDGFTVGTEPVTLDVMVRSDGGTIEGSLSATEKTSVLVVLIPSPQLRNNHARYSSMTTQGPGSFRLRGIAPGEYKLFAWEGVQGTSESQPYRNGDYIARYETRGVPVTVAASSTLTGVKVVAIPMGQ
jgi:protocatechuate 3,4-dioxygenase beta subunit